ncbi:MAG: hypothetical protein ACFE0I_14775 [Elainellaceae cyanobacterium]
MVQIFAVDSSQLIDPYSLWSLWVPLVLLAFIVMAAVFFARIRIR